MAIGPDYGSYRAWPVRVGGIAPGQTTESTSIAPNMWPEVLYDRFHRFAGNEANVIELGPQPFVNSASNADLVQLGGSSGVARAYFVMPRAGLITEISFAGEDGITQHGTNFQTFTGLNLKTVGTGTVAVLSTTAHVNTTDINAAALNGGSDLTAKRPYNLVLHGTAANLYVKKGDVIEITATADGTGAVVDNAYAYLKLRALPPGLEPGITHTEAAGALVPLAVPSNNVVGGAAVLQLSATNEAQTVYLSDGDNLTFDPTKTPIFQAKLQISGAAANTRFVWGFASAFNSTLDNIVSNAWFRIEGNSLALLVEGDDGTTDTDDQATVPATTLVAATDYIFTVDFSRGKSAVEFWVNNSKVGTVSVSALTASTLLQPFLAVQKASGTGTQSMTISWVRALGFIV